MRTTTATAARRTGPSSFPTTTTTDRISCHLRPAQQQQRQGQSPDQGQQQEEGQERAQDPDRVPDQDRDQDRDPGPAVHQRGGWSYAATGELSASSSKSRAWSCAVTGTSRTCLARSS